MTADIPRRFYTDDENTFGQHTATTRWPIIVQNMIDDMDQELAKLNDKNSSKFTQGNTIIELLSQLRQEILDNSKLRPFDESEIETANIPLSFNEYLIEKSSEPTTWGQSEWLSTEVYLYRRVNAIFVKFDQWIKYDIFNNLKQSTFQASKFGVIELATRYKNLLPEFIKFKQAKDKSQTDLDLLKTLFKEFIEISLWGNATDLSLLTNATLEDIKSIQGAKARQASESKIIVNDTDKAWSKLLNSFGKDKTHGNVRVDFVLDNSGFELYADLMLAAFFLQTGLADTCIFHAKDIPYMVSDVMIKDLDILLNDLRDISFFYPDQSTITEDDKKDIETLNFFADEVSNFVKNGKLLIKTDSFWTTGLDYWKLVPEETKYHGAEIHKDLLNSALVIFKGDLNYRKLTGDRTWIRTTPWSTAIGPMSSNGIISLSLRTCKADVQVALPEGLDEQFSKEWEIDHPRQGSWWCSSGKWAVVCFSDGEK